MGSLQTANHPRDQNTRTLFLPTTVAFVKASQSIRDKEVEQLEFKQAHEQDILNHPENSSQTEEFAAIFTKNNKLLDYFILFYLWVGGSDDTRLSVRRASSVQEVELFQQ